MAWLLPEELNSTLLLLFSHSVLSDSFATPWTAPRQASLSFTIAWSLLKLMSIESVMPSSHLTLCHPLLPPPSIFPSIRVFSNESVLLVSTLVPMKTAKNAEGKTETEEAQPFSLTWESWWRILSTTETSSWLLPPSPELPLNTLYPKPNTHPRSQRKLWHVTLNTRGSLLVVLCVLIPA